LHPILPVAYTSWTQVLTDWRVSSVYPVSDPPACLQDRLELAAPLVAAIAAFFRERQFQRHPGMVAMLQDQAAESVCAQAGGRVYADIAAAMQAAQDRYLSARCRRSTRSATAATKLARLRAEMEQHQTAFHAARRACEPKVASARSNAARQYWSANPAIDIPDTFFADAPVHSVPARLQRIHPPWWGGFLSRLQKSFSSGHPAEGRLLDELPRLRQERLHLKLSARLAEWHEAHADQWGLYTTIHYRMVADRAADKAAWVTAWFETTAPGYLADENRRLALHQSLMERLAAADPWAVAMPALHLSPGLSEHGPN
jgi:hypothetical protein